MESNLKRKLKYFEPYTDKLVIKYNIKNQNVKIIINSIAQY